MITSIEMATQLRVDPLGQLLSLELPEEWYKTAIILLLSTPLAIPPRDITSIANYYNDPFEATLRQLIRTPHTQTMAIRFFATLAEHGYLRKVQLLEILLSAGTLTTALMETLLVAARLDIRSIVNLLENHCQLLLARYELAPTFISYIQQYFVNFDVDYLNSERTKELLQRLRERRIQPKLRLPDDLHGYVQGWCDIIELLEQPAKGRQWLREINGSVCIMPLLTPDTQAKLTTLLMPHLIEIINTEADLCRVIDHLGHVLMGGGIGTMKPCVLLLEQLTTTASRAFKQERPPLRFLPYIKLVLEEAHSLPSPEKEEFVYRCLSDWVRSVDTGTLQLLNFNAQLWPTESQSEWKTLLAQPGLQAVTNRIAVTRPANLTAPQVIVAKPPLALSAEAQGDVHSAAAIVNGQAISVEQLKKMYWLKHAYIQYENHVQQRSPTKEQARTHIKESPEQTSAQQLQKQALDELIDDLLIREEIAKLTRQDSSLSLKFDPDRQLSPRLQSFKEFYGVQYRELLRRYLLDDADVATALRIFIRRSLFEFHLQIQRKTLSQWLKERKRKINIIIKL